MAEIKPDNTEREPNQSPSWEERVENKERRKMRARSQKSNSIWFGLGMFGMVGWSIAVPTLIGIFVGLWIDRTWPGQASWTLMLMLAGLVTGCINAWNWIHTESGVNKRAKKYEEHDEDQ